MSEEARSAGLGSALVLEHLTDLLLVQALRAVARRGVSEGQTGWLAALADLEIGRALHLMHQAPERRWTVADLGSAVGLSRSTFAERFRRLVGQPPLDYLVQWRMSVAAEALERNDQTVSSIASQAGYYSDSAFSAAFKRVMGMPPAHYRTRPYHLVNAARPFTSAKSLSAAVTREPEIINGGGVRPRRVGAQEHND